MSSALLAKSVSAPAAAKPVAAPYAAAPTAAPAAAPAAAAPIAAQSAQDELPEEPTISLVQALWAPGAREGHTCFYSRERHAALLFGGLRPGFGAQGDFVECSSTPQIQGALTSIAWQVLKVSNVPKRCYHGAALHEATQQIIIFGGEKANDGGRDGGRSECINDTWLIRLRDEFAAPVIAEEGMPPTPRMHHSLSAVDLGNGAFRVVVLGGVRSGSIPRRDDCVHLLHMTADGIARWRSGMHALTASAEAKVKANPPVVSEMAIRMARRAGNGSDATREATQREEQRVRASMEELCALLERYAHSACVEGKRVILFGGRCAQGTLHVASDALVSFDSETMTRRLCRPSAARLRRATRTQRFWWARPTASSGPRARCSCTEGRTAASCTATCSCCIYPRFAGHRSLCPARTRRRRPMHGQPQRRSARCSCAIHTASAPWTARRSLRRKARRRPPRSRSAKGRCS